MRTYKQVSITISPNDMGQFKQFCKTHSLPLSRFLCYSGQRFIKQETEQPTEKLHKVAPIDSNYTPEGGSNE
jgi:hypothetical protein